MKIALISDIHGNLAALEAVVDDIYKRKIDKVICLGDIIGKGPNTKEAIDICRKECDIVIKGNWDDGLYSHYVELSRGQARDTSESARWYINSADPERMEYLGSLRHSAEFYLSGKLIRVFHAHPKNFNRYFSDSPVEQRLELFDYGETSEIKKAADVAIYADIHSVYMQVLNGRYLLNTGSVGNPLDINRASYVIVEGEESSTDESSFNVQFVRVPYDIERAVAAAKELGVPDLDGYISELTTARYFRRGG